MTTEETDDELVARYRGGNVAALEALVQRHKRLVFGYVTNMTQGREDADEVFQEVWLKVIRKLNRYRQKNFKGWLLRIAHNIVIDRARRRKPDLSLDEERNEGRPMQEMIAGSDADPGTTTADRDLGRRIATAVAQLPEEQRETFLMRVESGLAFKEIARVQGVSINTALARMHYAIGKLRPLLRDDYETLQA